MTFMTSRQLWSTSLNLPPSRGNLLRISGEEKIGSR